MLFNVFNFSAISVASSSSRKFLNSKRGLNATLIVNLIKGFHTYISTSLYSSSTYELSKSIMYIMTNKRIMSFTSSHTDSLRYNLQCKGFDHNFIINPDTVQTSSSLHICLCCSTIKTQLATITTSIKSEISSVQTQIYAQGSTPNLFAKDVATISYPFTGTISTTSSSLTVKLEKIRILKSLFANKNGLEMAIKAIRTATTSTSTTGATGNVKERKALIFPLFKCRCNNHIQSSIN